MVFVVSKEKARSIVVCTDKDFRVKSVALIKGAAFPGEKNAYEDMKDAVLAANDDNWVRNFVIDTSHYTLEKLVRDLTYFNENILNKDMNLLIYLSDEMEKNRNTIEFIFENAYIATFPQEQIDYNKCFHRRRNKIKPTQLLGLANVEFDDEDDSDRSSPESKTRLSLMETSNHIKDTVNMINIIARERSNLKVLNEIGLKFSALSGTFKFFAKDEGYSALGELANIIETISRNYDEGSDRELSDRHYKIINEAARCSYLILKDMRSNNGLGKANIDLYEGIEQKFKDLTDIQFKNDKTQAEIDLILEEHKMSS